MRKEIEITLLDRGKELIFKIREMPASKLEKWLMKAVLLIAQSREKNTNLSENDESQISTFAHLFASNKLELLLELNFEKAEPLLDELLTCVQRKVDSALIAVTPDNIDTFIDDVETLFRLRLEVLKLNLDFFTQEIPFLEGNMTSKMNQEEALKQKEESKVYKMKQEAQNPQHSIANYDMRIYRPK